MSTQSTPAAPALVVKLPAALSMLMKSFAIDPEKVSAVANEIICKGETILANGTLDKFLGVLETLERVENKLDALLEKMQHGS